MSVRFPIRSRVARIALAALGVVVVIAVAFDWNWFRGPLEHYLGQRSHREVRIGKLEVDVGGWLEPTVRVYDVYVQNAPWAGDQPAAVAREAAFTFSLQTLWEGRPVISRLVLVDADVTLERRADGLRNWRLRNPDDRSPGRVKVLRLEAQRSRVHFIGRHVDLDVVATARPAQGGGDASPADASHPNRIAFEGRYAGAPFSGEVDTGAVLTFLDTGEVFPLRGHAVSGKSRLDVDGTVADLIAPSSLQAKVRLVTPSLAAVRRFARVALPASRPIEVEAEVTHEKDTTAFKGVRAKVGKTELTGEFSIARSGERPKVRAVVRTAVADLADLGSLLNEEGGPRSEATGNAAPVGERPVARLFSARPFSGERLKNFDAHIVFAADRVRAAALPLIESAQATVTLENGLLVVDPVRLGVAGGHVRGRLTVDARSPTLAMTARARIDDVRVERLLARSPARSKGAGPVDGHVDVAGQGNSLAKLAGSASGTVRFGMERGGISNLLDAKLGLNGGKILRLMIAGDRPIGIRSAAANFDVRRGVATSSALLLDTDQTHTEGQAVIDLGRETVDALLTPRPKKPGLFSLGSSIRILGPLQQPTITLQRDRQSRLAVQ